jgi:antitoxin FitA
MESCLENRRVNFRSVYRIDMRRACNYALRMSTMVQIRNVPDELHRKLKARAALAGMSISEYLLREIERSLERPTREELLARLRSREQVEPREPIAAAVAAEREGR